MEEDGEDEEEGGINDDVGNQWYVMHSGMENEGGVCLCVRQLYGGCGRNWGGG